MMISLTSYYCPVSSNSHTVSTVKIIWNFQEVKRNDFYKTMESVVVTLHTMYFRHVTAGPAQRRGGS